ncbi:restriction endonuclease [Hoeflea alexandrii]|uniref:restriction endonuclease n=1 Tax=Hoeflea alexandrii TaxID=288436 RepID=UPI0022AF5EC2|nr:restriction endonuclease [Hoeflea alexandrii]MCZ4292055.1 restriction endonuclease [Hoeflea alexandrii]
MSKLSAEECDALDLELTKLRADESLDPRELELVLGRVLKPLFGIEGYDVEHTGGMNDQGIDFRASRGADETGSAAVETIGVQAKFYRKAVRLVAMADVHKLIGAALLQGLSRVVLVSNGEFSGEAHAAVEKSLPLQIELLDLGGLRRWISRLRGEKLDVEAEVRIMLRDLSSGLARLIGKSPDALDHLEWRMVEQVVAEVFEGLGFVVTLTPGSKDGGKDVILTCTVKGKLAEYYVEIKHWRSSTKVGSAAVEKLLKVIVEEKKDGGLFLSTYGFTSNAFEQLTTIDKQKLIFGDQEKIVTFCQTYVKAKAGLWSPPENLTEILFA